MKLLKIVAVSFLAIGLLVWLFIPKQVGFPTDLMLDGLPIHPFSVVSTQFGDSSRFEKKIAFPLNHSFEPDLFDHVFSFNPKTKAVMSEAKYLEYDNTHGTIHENYCYIGTYKNKHIVLTDHYDPSGSGRFAELGLIVRENDQIINSGQITGGDRAHGGLIEVISHEKNRLRYRSVTTPSTLCSIIEVDDSFALNQAVPASPLDCGAWLLYEVDLDDPLLQSHLYGIAFNEDWLPYDGNNCFEQVAQKYVAAGKKTLNLLEAKTFVEQVCKASE